MESNLQVGNPNPAAKLVSRPPSPSLNADGILDLGERTLADTLPVMQQLVEKRMRDEISDVLVVVRHPPVYTLGRGLQLTVRKAQAADSSVSPVESESLQSYQNRLPYPVVPVERGGEITFHDPGQFIGYPILKLHPEEGAGVGEYLEALQDLLMEVVRILSPGIEPRVSPLSTGVWIGEKKIASIGIAVRKWVTYHGFALNLSTDLESFRRVKPCGLDSQVVENLSTLAGRSLGHDEVFAILKDIFPRYFFRSA